MTRIFLSPHDDDHALFGAFTCLREKPALVVVFDGHVQGHRGLSVTAKQRKEETERAARLLDCEILVRLGFSDSDNTVTAEKIRNSLHDAFGTNLAQMPIFAPATEQYGHPQHNLCAEAVNGLNVIERYVTYTSVGKTTTARPVPVLEADWIYRKLMALSRYQSQFSLDPRMGCWQHFLRSQEEYYL